MKILSQKREGNRVFLEIEEDHVRFKEAIEKALIETGKEIKLPGFRPGKAPRELLERALDKEAVKAHAAQDLVSDLYPKIIEEAKIDPVDYPNVDLVQLSEGKPFIFKLEVDVYPTVKLGKYKGLKVEKRSTVVTDEDVAKVMGNLQNRYAQAGPDGKPELMPLDDEFAKKVSNFGTLAELKAEILSSMQKDREANVQADLKNNLIAAASTEAIVDIPKGMVEREVDVMLDELNSSLLQSGLTLDQYLKGIKKDESSIREEFRKSAEVRVKGKIILKAIAEEEKIKVLDEDIDKELGQMAKASGQEPEDLKKSLHAGQRKFIEEYLVRSKALEFLIEKANIKETKEEKK